VTYPREGVADHGPAECEPRFSDHKHACRKQYARNSSGRVERSIASVRMLREIEEEKLVVVRKLAVGHAFHPKRVECYHRQTQCPRPARARRGDRNQISLVMMKSGFISKLLKSGRRRSVS